MRNLIIQKKLSVINRSLNSGFRNKIKKFNGPYISSEPDINIYDLKEIKKDKSGILLASDGLWDELNREEVLKIMKSQNFSKAKIPGLILDRAIDTISYRTGNPAKNIKKKLISGVSYRNIHDDISMIYYELK